MKSRCCRSNEKGSGSVVKVSLRDNAVREYPAGTRIADIVEDLRGKGGSCCPGKTELSVIYHFSCRKTPG